MGWGKKTGPATSHRSTSSTDHFLFFLPNGREGIFFCFMLMVWPLAGRRTFGFMMLMLMRVTVPKKSARGVLHLSSRLCTAPMASRGLERRLQRAAAAGQTDVVDGLIREGADPGCQVRRALALSLSLSRNPLLVCCDEKQKLPSHPIRLLRYEYLRPLLLI